MTLVPSSYPAPARMAKWDDEQLEIIKRSVANGCSDEELAFFAQVCQHRALDPFAGEIVAIQRWDARVGRKVMVIQETVAGLRSLASRSGLYGGQDPPQWCGPDAVWREVWLEDGPPSAARVAIYRKDWDRPCVGIARYASYVVLGDKGLPVGLWKSGPDFMLWKCAEAAALKRAFKAEFAAVGASTREFSTAQRISMEARAVGMGADARHELVAGVTGGRTDSSREVDDSEALELRAELARLRSELEAQGRSFDPSTGEVDYDQSARSLPITIPAPGHELAGDAPVVPDTYAGRAVTPARVNPFDRDHVPQVAPDQEPASAGAVPSPASPAQPSPTPAGGSAPGPGESQQWAQKEDLDRAMPSLKAMTPGEIRMWREWLGQQGIPQEAVRWTGPHLEAVVAELQARGVWIYPDGEEPF